MKSRIATAALAFTLSVVVDSARAGQAKTEIVELEHFSLVLDHLEKSPDVWYIFDLDNTVMKPDSETLIGSHQWGNFIRDQLVAQGIEPDKANAIKDERIADVQPYVNVRLTAPDVKDILTEIDASPRFVLTARLQRSLAATLAQLKQVSVSFDGWSPKDSSNADLIGNHGIEIVGATSKGDVLLERLRSSARPPKAIVMFDDRRYNLEAVQAAIETWNVDHRSTQEISFTGYRYAGSDISFAELLPDHAENRTLAHLQEAVFYKSGTLHFIAPLSVLRKTIEESGGHWPEASQIKSMVDDDYVRALTNRTKLWRDQSRQCRAIFGAS